MIAAMDDAQLARRFQRLEAQVALLSQKAGLPFDDPTAVPVEVVELAQAGRTTEAVKRYRELTGTTLVEAKNVVDAL
jgi:ribosomal protein L7/L12